MSDITPQAAHALDQLEQVFGIEFQGDGRIPLGHWSYADRLHQINQVSFLYVEVERAQKHPTTNVLKYWPWLEEDATRRMLLVHVFDRNTARRPLTRWLAERMGQTLSGRFHYVEADLPLGDDDLAAVEEAFRHFSS